MKNAYIVDAVRTPRGRGNDKGSLRAVTPVDLMAQSLSALAARTRIDTARIADAIIGCVTQTGDQGTNIGKLALIAANWSDAAPGMTINRYCASGLTAVHYAAVRAASEDGLATGGGVEMMSRVPMGADKGPLTHDLPFQKAAMLVPIGIAARYHATQFGFTRQACDAYALALCSAPPARRMQAVFGPSFPCYPGKATPCLRRMKRRAGRQRGMRWRVCRLHLPNREPSPASMLPSVNAMG